MWLVVGGPATVVVAGVITGVLAHSGADRTVLPNRSARVAVEQSLEPAMKARNAASTHAASSMSLDAR